MWSIKNILLPLDLDFTDGNMRIAPYVLALSKQHHATIHLLHVLPDPTEYYGFYAVNMNFSEMSQAMYSSAKEKMADYVRESSLDAGNLQSHVVSGRPAQEIVAFAKARHMDLIVMGTHGRKGLEETFFGSVVRQVIKLSPVPVLAVNPLRPMNNA